eukprot:3087689-Prymnesium_polylepis.1
MNDVRRREQKEDNQAAAAERIVETQSEVGKLAMEAANTEQLVLQVRKEVLDLRATQEAIEGRYQHAKLDLKAERDRRLNLMLSEERLQERAKFVRVLMRVLRMMEYRALATWRSKAAELKQSSLAISDAIACLRQPKLTEAFGIWKMRTPARRPRPTTCSPGTWSTGTGGAMCHDD